MKNKILTVAAISLAAVMASCSSDDEFLDEPTPGIQSQGREIAYSVTADGNRRPASMPSARSAAIYNSNTLPASFHVAAWELPQGGDTGYAYIYWDQIRDLSPKSGHNWQPTGDKRYWPTGGETLDFYATNAASGSFTTPKNGRPSFVIPFTANRAAEGQTDLMYAMAFNQRPDSTSAASQDVELNFHHALAQVVFTAKAPNKNLEVDVERISVAGVNPSGNLVLPPASGDAVWQPSASAPATFTAIAQTPTAGAVNVGIDPTPLTSAANQTDQALMLMPQKIAAADPSDFSKGGAYLIVECTIWNKADPNAENVNVTTDALIFGTEDGGIYRAQPLYIPVNIDWQAGNRYVYTLNFGSGHGGYDANGKLILRDIGYSVTADDWQNVPSSVQEP